MVASTNFAIGKPSERDVSSARGVWREISAGVDVGMPEGVNIPPGEQDPISRHQETSLFFTIGVERVVCSGNMERHAKVRRIGGRTVRKVSDPYLTELHDSLNDSPLQRKFRKIRPMPVGVVFIQWPGMDWADMRRHLKLMRQLGFTCLKDISLRPGFDRMRFCHMALDEGIIPWWYGEAGWEEITDKLLDRLGIPRNTPIEKVREDRRFLAHQDRVMRRRIDRMQRFRRTNDLYGDNGGHRGWKFSVGAELGTRAVRISEEGMPLFAEWLKAKYGKIDILCDAWNTCKGAFGTWEEAASRLLPGHKDHDYNRYKDLLRFKTRMFLEQLRRGLDPEFKNDPNAPIRAGGEMSVFLPLAGRGIDMEGIAGLMTDRGSLYPSTHLAWHFDVVNYELTRTIYMYSSIVCDVFKGGWSATWESTGGPQQISGDKGWTAFAKEHLPAYTVDAGVMTQFMLSYLAAGYKGFGFWCWTARPFGREAGEYSLLDRNCRPGSRAVRVGQIGRAARRWRDELWQSHKEPLVGVLFDQENDMQWSVIADFGRETMPHFPVLARVGIARALINANVPWEHVTAKNLKRGLAGRYRVIYLPGMLCVTSDLVPLLVRYVKEGGRLVMDMPGYYMDDRSRVTDTGPGSAFESLFGCTLDDYQYASNVPGKIGACDLKGFVADMTPTTAKVVARYNNGRPAVMENRMGKGTAVILGYEASQMCARPGRDDVEAMLVRQTLGSYRAPFRCKGAIVYRLASPDADHYFLVNDGPASTVSLETGAFRYGNVVDAVTGARIGSLKKIVLEPHSGRWLRMAKKR